LRNIRRLPQIARALLCLIILEMNLAMGLPARAASPTVSPSEEVVVPPLEYAIRSRDVTFGNPTYNLKATLTLPREAKGKVPAVIIIGGSGPVDRDGTVGENGQNKPYKDLAEGLTRAGFAVLRYDKRVVNYHYEVDEYMRTTLKDEYFEDVQWALQWIRQQPQVDPYRIFLLGHSLGGVIAMIMAQWFPLIKGVIMMATPGRYMDELQIYQYRLFAKRVGASDAQLDDMEARYHRVYYLLRHDQFPKDIPFDNLFQAYWYDILNRNPDKIIRQVRQPMLILQGDRDYQVTLDDVVIFKHALAEIGNHQATVRVFGRLNHIFMPYEGNLLAEQYDIPGHVPDEVLQTIASWIRTHLEMR